MRGQATARFATTIHGWQPSGTDTATLGDPSQHYFCLKVSNDRFWRLVLLCRSRLGTRKSGHTSTMTQSLMIVGGRNIESRLVESGPFASPFFLQADKVDPELDGTAAYWSLSAVHRHGPFLARRLILSAAIGLGHEPLLPGKESCLR